MIYSVKIRGKFLRDALLQKKKRELSLSLSVGLLFDARRRAKHISAIRKRALFSLFFSLFVFFFSFALFVSESVDKSPPVWEILERYP